MKREKLVYPLLAGCISIAVIFVVRSIIVVQAAPTSYWFNNAINTNPATLGNYWLDEDLTIHATELPDLSEDEVTIVSGATYTGNAIFNGSASNSGTVTGNAEFRGDLSENFFGTVNGIKSRRYIGTTHALRDFTEGGAWTVIADGGVVDIVDCSFDNTTTFVREHGGYFYSNGNTSGFEMNPFTITAFKDKVYIFYRQDFDEVSDPHIADYTVTVNGSPVTISNLLFETYKVTLTLAAPITYSNTLRVDYTIGATPLVNAQGLNADTYDDYVVSVIQPQGDAPVYSTLVGKKLYISNNHSSSLTVVDTTNNTLLDPIPVEPYPELSLLVGYKLYVNNQQTKSISVVDTRTDTVITTIPADYGVYFSSVVGNKIYASNTGSNTISVINTDTDTLSSNIVVGMAPWQTGVVGTKLYVPNRDSNSVSVINTVTDTVVATIPVSPINGLGTRALPVGKYVYVGKSNSMAVIDSTSDTVVATVATGNNPYFSCLYGTKIYAVNRTSGSVTVINTLTNTVTTTISVGGQPTTCQIVDGRVYVTSDGNSNNTIAVIDPVSNTLIQTVTVGNKPFYATPVGKKLYVSNNFSNNYSVVDTTTISSQLPSLTSFSTSAANGTYTTGQIIPITANFGQTLLAGSTMTVTLNTGASVVLNSVSGTTLSGNYTIAGGHTTPDLSVTAVTSASVSDLSSHTRTSYVLPSSQGNLVAENSFITRNLGDSKDIVIGSYLSVPVGTNPYQISAPVNVNGTDYLYVANQGDHSVSVMRQPDNSVVNVISVGSEPYGLATVTLSGTTYVYVANTGSDNVSVINTDTNAVVATVNVGVRPYYVAAVGSTVYVTNSLSNTVSAINAVTNTLITTIPVGLYPRGIKARGTEVYVANYGNENYSGGNSISVINSLTNTVTASILSPGGSDGPRGLNVLGTKVYVTNFRSNNVSVIDTATKTITNTINVGKGPRGVVGLGSKVYIENFDDGTISVIDTGTNAVTATLQVGNAPSGISVDGTDLYLTRFQDSSVSILNTLTNTLRPAGPLLSGLTVTVQTPTTAEVRWTTDKTSDSLIEYGLTTAYGSSASSATLTTTHIVSLSDLVSGRTYHYRVTSFDVDGNAVISPDSTFSTPGGGGGGGSVGVPIVREDVSLPPASQESIPNPDNTTTLPENSPEPVKHPVFFCPGWTAPASLDKTSDSLAERLKGWFLLAVEDRGSLWYVHTVNGYRYEVKLPTALCLFQYTAQGISNIDIQKIPEEGKTSTPLGERLQGSILIQPQADGQTSYVDLKGFRHNLTVGNLLSIAAKFAVGITNANLEKISVGSGQ